MLNFRGLGLSIDQLSAYPRTYEQLNTHMKPHLHRVLSLPVCPRRCSLLTPDQMDDDKQSDVCTACGTRSFRYTKSGECKPLLMFQASDLTDITRGRWAHPIISKLLRYGYEYKRDDILSRRPGWQVLQTLYEHFGS